MGTEELELEIARLKKEIKDLRDDNVKLENAFNLLYVSIKQSFGGVMGHVLAKADEMIGVR